MPKSEWDLGPVDQLQWICREWIQELGFNEFDNRAVSTKGMWASHDLDGLMIRGDELTIRGCELLSNLIKQSTKGDESFSPSGRPPPFYGRSLTLYSSLWTIMVLHLLVIHTYTWMHIPSATSSDILWVVVTQIALFRGHVHINKVRMLAVGI